MEPVPEGDGWARIEEIFSAATDLPEFERVAVLDRLCGADAALRSEVERLLDADARTSVLDGTAAQLLAPVLDQQHSRMIGRSLGLYRIEREIGHGGMGTVFLARRDHTFQKDVAVKIVRDALSRGELVRRFEIERRIVAQLDHPYIARLIDGGATEEGLPYLVMEYVDGKPIDRYCRERALPVRECLQLFLRVCSAVQAAHQILVIHRDLKPTNVLVTADGTPKLLDFGIAKILAEDSSLAQQTGDLRLLTPEYASPEQINGGIIGTASDVYSLGVMLFEMLTGRSPYLGMSVAEILLAARDGQPRLRNDDAGIDSDLSTIVAKAMQPERTRRYESVQQLADDLHRYLEGRPVLARPDSFLYRTRKFLRRNVLGVAAAAVLLLSMGAGVGATLHQKWIADAERDRAERRFRDVRAMANALVFDVQASLQRLPGALETRQTLVRRALTYLDALAHESADDRSLQAQLAAAYDSLGNLTFDTAAAMQAHQTSARMFEELVRAEPKVVSYRVQLVTALLNSADALKIVGRFDEAFATAHKALSLAQPLAATHPWLVADCHDSLGGAYAEWGDSARALVEREKTAALAGARAAADPSNPSLGRAVGIAEDNLGTTLIELHRNEEARAHLQRAAAITHALIASDPVNVGYERDLWINERKTGLALGSTGQLEPARRAFTHALQIIKALSAADPGDLGHRRAETLTHLDYSEALLMMNRPEEALPQIDQAMRISRALSTDAARVEAKFDHARAELDLGVALRLLGRNEAGDSALREVVRECALLAATRSPRASEAGRLAAMLLEGRPTAEAVVWTTEPAGSFAQLLR